MWMLMRQPDTDFEDLENTEDMTEDWEQCQDLPELWMRFPDRCMARDPLVRPRMSDTVKLRDHVKRAPVSGCQIDDLQLSNLHPSHKSDYPQSRDRTHRPSQAHKATDYDMASQGSSDLGELAKTFKVLEKDFADSKPQTEELEVGTQDLETTITQLHEQVQIIAQAQDEFSRSLLRLYDLVFRDS
ncbi:hypothetical protein LTR17_016530 [Elasticomyces elasticus]|nr:hypothetical protein LTR17_016530 [Elasticomyces elasticus]